MKTAATQPKTQQPPQPQPGAQNGRIEYVVLEPITWHGKSYLQNQIVDFCAKGSHANRDRWLAAGKIKLLDEVKADAQAKNPGKSAPPIREVKMGKEEMEKLERTNICGFVRPPSSGSRRGRKPVVPTVQAFKYETGYHVVIGASASGHLGVKGITEIYACELLTPSEFNPALATPPGEMSAKGMLYYGAEVLFEGVPHRVGRDSLRISRSDLAPTPKEPSDDGGWLKDDSLTALGVTIGSKLTSQADGSVWYIHKWGEDKGGIRLYLVDQPYEGAFQKGKFPKASSYNARWVERCVQVLAGMIVADGSIGEAFDVATETACAKPAVAAAKVAQPSDGKAADPGTFQMTELALLDPPPWNPRQDFESAGAREDLAGLVQSVREQGIIEPLIIRPLPEGRFEVVAGERRRRAANEAGLAAVPAILRQLDDVAALRIQAIENLQRRDINPLEECHGYQRLMERGGYSVADLVRETGKSEASIYARLVLAKAPPGIRKALQEGRIPASTAELVARIDDVSFQGVAMDAILFPEHGEAEDGAEVLSFRQAKAWIAARRERARQEEEWTKAARGSHVAKREGVRVLTVEQSNEAIYGGGYVKNRQHFLKPEDHCYTDPENRTFAEIAKAAGRELPAPVIARDPEKGTPVHLLDRKATEAAIADLVPNEEEQQRRRQAAEELRKKEWQEADAIRRQHAVDLAARAKSIEALCQAGDEWDPQREEAFARFLVRRMIEERVMDNAEDLAEVLTANGCPCDKKEADGFDAAWLTDYLAGCDLGKLRRWQMYFALRGEYDVSFVEEEALDRAEEIFDAARI